MIKLTTKGRQHLFGSTDFTDETDIKYMFFDTSVTSTNVESICENWTHNSTDLSKLASPSKQIFNNLRYGIDESTSNSTRRTMAFLSDSSPLIRDFTKDTGGYAAVINNANECLGHIKVMEVSASAINAVSGAEQSWDNMIVCSVSLDYRYRADYIAFIFRGGVLLSDLKFRVVHMLTDADPYSNFGDSSTSTKVMTDSDFVLEGASTNPPSTSQWESRSDILSNDVLINNLRLEGDKLVFDDQFIELTSEDVFDDISIVVVVEKPLSTYGVIGPLCFLTPKIDTANGGVFVSCGPDGLFNFV